MCECVGGYVGTHCESSAVNLASECMVSSSLYIARHLEGSDMCTTSTLNSAVGCTSHNTMK